MSLKNNCGERCQYYHVVYGGKQHNLSYGGYQRNHLKFYVVYFRFHSKIPNHKLDIRGNKCYNIEKVKITSRCLNRYKLQHT